MFLPSHAVPFTNYYSHLVELVANFDLLSEDPRPDLERMHEANRQEEATRYHYEPNQQLAAEGEVPMPMDQQTTQGDILDEASRAAATRGHADDDIPREGKVSSLLLRYHRNSNEVVISQKVVLVLMMQWIRRRM